MERDTLPNTFDLTLRLAPQASWYLKHISVRVISGSTVSGRRNSQQLFDQDMGAPHFVFLLSSTQQPPGWLTQMNDQVESIVYEVVDAHNRENRTGAHLRRSRDTALFGSSSDLDSLEFINFLVAVEERVEQRFGNPIMLMDDKALSQEPSPFTSIGTLVDYVRQLVGEVEDGG